MSRQKSEALDSARAEILGHRQDSKMCWWPRLCTEIIICSLAAHPGDGYGDADSNSISTLVFPGFRRFMPLDCCWQVAPWRPVGQEE
uniref:HDC14639 n=1 Tax=Drosophila melanogaster TaxID=7227 RepID=Q6IJL4_DROME|nr:TPA_inf: HDC14639 [Drosophila melanogaster]